MFAKNSSNVRLTRCIVEHYPPNDHQKQRVEEELERNRIRLNQALNAARAGIWEWNLDTGENIWSDEIWELYGLEFRSEEPSFELWLSTIIPEDRQRVIQTVSDASERREELNVEYRVRGLDGALHWLMSRGKPFRDEHGRVTHYIGTIIDVTQRREIEEELSSSRQKLDYALEKSGIAWWELDLKNKTVKRSAGHDRIYGYSSMLPEWTFETFLSHIYEEDRAAVMESFQHTMERREEGNIEFRILGADGELRWLCAEAMFRKDGKSGGDLFSGIIQDITERKLKEELREQMQSELQQAQKMGIIGQLAGGIAHDFNNMLTVILGNTELLRSQIDDTHPFADSLRDIYNSASRSAELTRQLLTFARKQQVEPVVLDVTKTLAAMKPMLSRLVGSEISLNIDVAADNACILIDPSQFDQIISNLCINARDALDGKGTIDITTVVEHVGKHGSSKENDCTVPGNYLVISFADNGIGIGREELPHIFEPFYTTKSVGKGTGLGLSIVYGIVKQAQGCISCRSEPGNGTVFRIYLPLASEAGNDAGRHGAVAESLAGYRATILLVEDQQDILGLLKGILSKAGYTVLAASDGEEAMAMVDNFSGKIDLLVTDIVMPKMNGTELYHQLRRTRPSLKVLFMSGYASGTIDVFEAGATFIQKPFAIKKLLSTMIKLLDQVRI